ncbi:hypothetical protein CRUP_016805 [Coryphaenoides rupestris]|nr:hypothetical protein CRUP_016805 [Coryphaenoides rupestris]
MRYGANMMPGWRRCSRGGEEEEGGLDCNMRPQLHWGFLSSQIPGMPTADTESGYLAAFRETGFSGLPGLTEHQHDRPLHRLQQQSVPLCCHLQQQDTHLKHLQNGSPSKNY